MVLDHLCRSVLPDFIVGQYSANKAINHLLPQAKKLGLNKDAVNLFKEAQECYHKYSHPSILTIANAVSFSQNSALYLGASFDPGKFDAYQLVHTSC
jgi:hypothetical protein